MSLEDEIHQRRREIATEAYAMSIGELTNLYKENELDVHPEFQRIYRWGDLQKSRLIESILLGIPLPSLFVAQTEEGTWDVVDGVQRLCTILQLQGLLKDENGDLVPPLTLTDTRYLPSLVHKKWDDPGDEEHSLTQAQRLDFRRAKIDLKIIKRESDPQAKYDLFQRLNAYGAQLTQQELRSCLLVSISTDFYEWLRHLAQDEHFTEAIALTERLRVEQYDLELALRFIILHSLPLDQLRGMGNLGDFLTQEATRRATDDQFPYDVETEAFRDTFRLLAESGGDDVFRKFNPQRDRFQGAFSNTAFEILGIGLGFHISHYRNHEQDIRALERAKSIWADPDSATGSATGLSADARLARTIPQGRDLWDPPRGIAA